MTDAEWRLIEVAAAAHETYPSTWLRAAALREARRQIARPDDDADRAA